MFLAGISILIVFVKQSTFWTKVPFIQKWLKKSKTFFFFLSLLFSHSRISPSSLFLSSSLLHLLLSFSFFHVFLSFFSFKFFSSFLKKFQIFLNTKFQISFFFSHKISIFEGGCCVHEWYVHFQIKHTKTKKLNTQGPSVFSHFGLVCLVVFVWCV